MVCQPGAVPPLTCGNVNVLRLVAEYIRVYGYAPTSKELSAILEIKPHGVFRHLQVLRIHGVLENKDHVTRSLMVTEYGRALLMIAERHEYFKVNPRSRRRFVY